MKLRYLTLALGIMMLAGGCDQLQSAGQGQGSSSAPAPVINDTSAVEATVNGTPITAAVLDLYEKQMKNLRPGAAIDRKTILDEVITLELASQSGSKQGLDKDTALQLQIEQQRRSVIAAAAIQNYLKDHPITDDELKKLYDEQVPKGNEYKARHILVDDEEQAKKLIAELEGGADFSELAKQYSTGPSGKSGGELGWFSPKQMVAPFSEAVAKLEKGGYTKEPVKTQFGWHVIILDDVRESTPPSFEQLKPRLQAFAQKQRIQQYVSELRKGAKIEIMNQAPESSAPVKAETTSESTATETAETETKAE
ncbi:MAG: peptidylprolyl isomerase [Thiogranum sp.]|jgi:peptidyl-prolyl cis-trans isomerase C